MSLAPGTKLGPYEIVAPLGAGGMGEVYRARDTRLERAVAIKVLPQNLSSSPEVRQRFEDGAAERKFGVQADGFTTRHVQVAGQRHQHHRRLHAARGHRHGLRSCQGSHNRSAPHGASGRVMSASPR